MANRAVATRKPADAPLFAPLPSSLPPSVAMVVADPPETTVERKGQMVMVPGQWAPPMWPIPKETLETARKAIEHMLKPAGDEGLRAALLPLMLSSVMPNMDGMEDTTMQAFFAAKVAEYSRLINHVPADIIRDACDAHVLKSKFFPAIAELMEHATPALEHRKRQAHRIGLLLKGGGQPIKPAFVPDPEHVRLLGMLKHYERVGGSLYSAAKSNATRKRLQELHDAELELASTEGRDAAEWTVGNRNVGAPVIAEPLPDEIPA